VREWIELWVQDVSDAAASLPSHRELLANRLLDQRWGTCCDAIRAWAPESFIETGWEKRHPRPLLIDLSTYTALPPEGPAQGPPWLLCEDDALLQSASLPAYSTSLARYLYQPSAGQSSRFVPVVKSAPENAATIPAAQALGLTDRLTLFNLQGGLTMATSFYPFGYEEYVDVLGGKPWSGLACGKTPFDLSEPYQSLTDRDPQQCSGGFLFLGAQGRAGRFLETLHLKLHLLMDAVRAVRNGVAAYQLPFLNLSPESFRVKLNPLGTALPCFWTARCAVVKPPQAYALRVPTTEQRLFLRGAPLEASIYLPESRLAGGCGLGSVRVRQALRHEGDTLILEGTLALQEPVRAAARDLLWIRLPLADETVDLYGHIEHESLAFADVRFRTEPQKLSATVAAALLSATVVVFPQCQYEIIPMLSSPCDLYALAVLAMRTLLVHDKAALPAALDDVLSLARQVAREHLPNVPLPERIQSIFDKKPQWIESLGPHRLTVPNVTPQEGLAWIPRELWCEVLALMIRCLPGTGPDAYCADVSDAPPLALEMVFDGPLAQLESLLVKTRSLIVIDWNYNREVRTVIDELQAQ
jgi:hypothetical protein